MFAKTQPNQPLGRDMERRRPLSARTVSSVARRMPDGRWLDLGSGHGSLLFTAEERGFVPAGLDFREANARALKPLGYEVHHVPIETLDHSARYSVINLADVLAHMSFPREHWAKLHSTNGLERLNGEVKRRTDVVGIFPNDEAIVRLVGAILLEQNDESAVQRSRYMTLETIAQLSDDPIVGSPAMAI